MARTEAKTADELTTAIRSLVDSALESEVRDQVVSRGREVATILMNAGETAAEKAGEAWRDSEPMRNEAREAARRAGRDAMTWSRATWTRQLRPVLRDAWTKRMAALSAAGIAVPTSRLALRRREEHGWRWFFVGVVLGAVGGAVAALLTAPRPGREVRDELATRAREAATNAREVRDELATRAREAATSAREVATSAREAAGSRADWVPLFQRPKLETESGEGLDADGNGASETVAETSPELSSETSEPSAETGPKKRKSVSAPEGEDLG